MKKNFIKSIYGSIIDGFERNVTIDKKWFETQLSKTISESDKFKQHILNKFIPELPSSGSFDRQCWCSKDYNVALSSITRCKIKFSDINSRTSDQTPLKYHDIRFKCYRIPD